MVCGCQKGKLDIRNEVIKSGELSRMHNYATV